MVLVGAALYLAVEMLAEVGWEALRAQLLGAEPVWLAAVVGVLLCRWLVWNERWRAALAAVGVTVARRRSFFAIAAAAALNHLTPSFRVFGGLVRARYVTVPPHAFATSYGAVLFDQLANQAVAAVLAASAFVGVTWHLGRTGEATAAVVALTALVLLVPLLHRHFKRRGLLPWSGSEGSSPGRLGRRLRPLAEHGREVLDTVRRLLARRGLLLGVGSLGLLLAGFNLLAAWLSFVALGATVAPLWVFFAVSLGITLGAVSGTPGGGLTTEAAMVTCYTLLGVEPRLALAAAILYRGLHYAQVVLLGVPALVVLETLHRSHRELPSPDRRSPQPPADSR